MTENAGTAARTPLQELLARTRRAGAQYLDAVAREMSGILDLHLVAIGITDPERPDHVRGLAAASRGEPIDAVSYVLGGTPCETLMEGSPLALAMGAADAFPLDDMLRDGRIECYVGVPLVSPDDRTFGVLALMDTRPRTDAQEQLLIAQVFAERIAWEIVHGTMERAIVESDALLRLGLESAEMGSWAWDASADRVEWSERVYQLFGLQPGQFDGTFAGFLQAVHPDDRQALREAVEQTVARRDPRFHAEHRVLLSDGSVRWLEGHGRAYFDARGQLVRMSGTVLDITARRTREAEERLRDQIHRTFSEVASAFVYVADVVEDIPTIATTVYGDLSGTVGYTMESLAAHGGWPSIVHPDDRDALLASQRLAVGGERQVLEYRVTTHDGATRWLRDYMQPERDASGRVARVIGGVQDITESRRLEERALDGLTLQAVGRLAGGVAHDFNNLLTTIIGHAEMAELDAWQSRDPRGAIAEHLSPIREAALRAAGLTRQLLAFARRQVIQPQERDLGELVESVRRLLHRVLGDEITLVVDVTDGLWPVRIDPGQFEQILLSLATNARDAMPSGGRVTIRVRNVEVPPGDRHAPPGRYVELAMRDTGAGMDRETLAHVFEPFFTTRPLPEGRGLGLAMCHGIVTQHGGRITAESEPGAGSTFTILLPRATHEAPMPDESPSAHGGTETILFVEDDAAVRVVGLRALATLGYTVLAAESGLDARAVAAAHEGGVDLLVTDVVLPESNGVDLARHLLGRSPGLKVLFTSGYIGDAVVDQGVLAGGHEFLAKPYTPGELAARVRALLDA